MATLSAPPETSRLADNILHFARLLRGAGVPVGTDRVLNAVAAVRECGIDAREDLYWVLFANLVSRQEHREIFDQAFHIFWRNPRLMERMLAMMLPTVAVDAPGDEEELNRRLAEALAGGQQASSRETDPGQTELDATLTFSAQESLREKDFEKMSSLELLEAKRAIARLRLRVEEVPTRRFRPAARGALIDMRATLRSSLRNEATIPLRVKVRRRRHPPLVILCDISGSMSCYSRLFLHFMHAISNDRDRVHAFVFATRLTNISHQLKQRDVDEALEGVAGTVRDWEGGTRIGACLKEFNNAWSRRVLAQGAVVLLITDGLDREAPAELSSQMERLAKSSRRLIWLNPLLRYQQFQPRAQGIKAMLPYVDEFRSAHNIDSLAALSELLNTPQPVVRGIAAA